MKPTFLDTAKLSLITQISTSQEKAENTLEQRWETKDFGKQFLKQKIIEWHSEIETLAKITQSQPQGAQATLTHGVIGRWVYAMKTYEYN